MSTTTDLTTLKINYLTQAQYDAEVSGGTINENEIYMTPMGDLIDLFYPVGSYYETSNTTFNPNVSWGGTWLLDSAGKVTVAVDANDTDLFSNFGTVGNTGGSKKLQSHTHVFTNPTVPNHTHKINDGYFVYSDNSAANNIVVSVSTSGTARKVDAGTNSSNNVFHHVQNTSSTGTCTTTGGGVGAVSSGIPTGEAGNVQPYIVVNRWHRTA